MDRTFRSTPGQTETISQYLFKNLTTYCKIHGKADPCGSGFGPVAPAAPAYFDILRTYRGKNELLQDPPMKRRIFCNEKANCFLKQLQQSLTYQNPSLGTVFTDYTGLPNFLSTLQYLQRVLYNMKNVCIERRRVETLCQRHSKRGIESINVNFFRVSLNQMSWNESGSKS